MIPVEGGGYKVALDASHVHPTQQEPRARPYTAYRHNITV